MDGGETARARGGFRARAPGLRCAWPAGDAAHRQFRPDHAAALLQARAQPEGQSRRVPLRATQGRRRPRRKVMTAADLFGRAEPVAPLADALRPKTLDEVVGQEHLLDPGSAMPLGLESGRPPSTLLRAR